MSDTPEKKPITFSFTFEPWKYFANTVDTSINIPEPPCKHCKHWNPRIKTNQSGEYDGVVLCTSPDMHHDFSCFKSKQVNQDGIAIVPAPADYEHPPVDKVFQVGDWVMTPDNRSGSVSAIKDYYYNRADERVDRPMYRVDTGLPGTPRVWWFGYELTLIKQK